MAERLSAVNEFARAVSSTLDLDSIFSLVVRQVCSLVGAERCSIARYDVAEDIFRVAAVYRTEEQAVVPGVALGSGDAASGIALRSRAPYVADDTQEGAPETRRLAEDGILSLISVPIAIEDRGWGTLDVGFGRAHAPSSDRVEFLCAIASHLAVAIKNAQLYTDLGAAHEQLRATQRQVIQQERLHALGQMASGIAHDFNNALMPVLGFSELLLDGPNALDEKDRVTRYVEIIRRGAQDAARVVGRLREFYRQRGEGEFFQPVDLNRVVEDVVSLTQPRWRDQAQASGITIHARTDPQDVPLVAGNEADLREAVVNLVLNAVDAMPTSGAITLRTRADDGFVSLEVEDTGTGMTEGVREHCLEPFFSTKGELGTGLGLRMVYGIVRRHEGTIDIQSREEKGTTVTIRLPVQAEPVNGLAASELAAISRPLRVLVVDDQPMVREVLEGYLKSDGHAVQTAADGREGLRRFRDREFDLVITDRGMPHMGGDELAAAIKEVSPSTPVVLLTGFGELMKATGEQPRGVDLILGKPVNLAELRETVAKVTAGDHRWQDD